MRVAVVAEQPLTSSSTQFRALEHLPRLRARLGEVDAFTLDDDVERGRGRLDQVRFFSRHAVRYVRRARELEHALRDYDAVLVQRGVYPMGPGFAVRGLERFEGRVVLDLDDAVFELAPVVAAKGRAGRWLYGPQQALRLLRRADAIVASTQALADLLPGGRRADAILPTLPDPEIFPRVEHRAELPCGSAGPATRATSPISIRWRASSSASSARASRGSRSSPRSPGAPARRRSRAGASRTYRRSSRGSRSGSCRSRTPRTPAPRPASSCSSTWPPQRRCWRARSASTPSSSSARARATWRPSPRSGSNTCAASPPTRRCGATSVSADGPSSSVTPTSTPRADTLARLLSG